MSDTSKAPQITLRLIETSDLHAHMLGYDYFQELTTSAYGLEHTAALIHAARAEQPNHITIDNGDLIQGSPLGDYVAAQGVEGLVSGPHPAIEVLNYLEYDVANLGNHEFNYGIPFLNEVIAGAKFPIISANVVRADDHQTSYTKPYVILERQFMDSTGQAHLVRVGVVGVVPPQIMQWDQQHLQGQLVAQDMVESTQRYVTELRSQGADVVVAVPHSGLELVADDAKFVEQAVYQLAGIAGIDAILFGHQHRLFPGHPDYDNLPEVDNQQGYIQGVPAVQPGFFGSHLGLIDLTLQQTESGWQVIKSDVSLRATTAEKDTAIAELITATQQATLTYLERPIGHTEFALSNRHARYQPSHAVQFIQDAQLWYAKKLQARGDLPDAKPLLSAAAPFRVDTELAAGELTLGDLANLYPYPNTLQVVEVSGAEVREWLEMSARAFLTSTTEQAEARVNQQVASFNFDTIAGLTYQIDTSVAARYDDNGRVVSDELRRIRELTYAGEPVTDDQKFLVVTNNYRASGGGQFPGLNGQQSIYGSTEEVRQIMVDYLKALGADGYQKQLVEHWQVQ